MIWIKICGITNTPDALGATSLGVDALGFIFASSPRRVDPVVAGEIIARIPEAITKVGVFVNESLAEVQRIAAYCGLDALQLHGLESPEYCRQISLPVIKAIGVHNAKSLSAIDHYSFTTLLLDAWCPDQGGGTGKTFSWELAREARKKTNFILSGGLNPGNVGQAVRFVQPMGVDVCSGVEEFPGKKDLVKMQKFVKEVRKTDAST